MKPYSRDLRQKIVDTYLEGEESIRQVAKRFQVSSSFVSRIIQKYRRTGTVDSEPHRGGTSSKLNPEQIDLVGELIEQYSDATLQELCNILESKIRVRISRSTMSRIIQQLRLNKTSNRKARQLTQERMSKILGIGQDSVSRLEKRTDLHLSTLNEDESQAQSLDTSDPENILSSEQQK
jgi:transposase